MSKKICFSPWVKKNLGEFLNNNYEDSNVDHHNCCLGDYNSNFASNYQIIVSGCQKGMDVIYLTEAQISDLFKKKEKNQNLLKVPDDNNNNADSNSKLKTRLYNAFTPKKKQKVDKEKTKYDTENSSKKVMESTNCQTLKSNRRATSPKIYSNTLTNSGKQKLVNVEPFKPYTNEKTSPRNKFLNSDNDDDSCSTDGDLKKRRRKSNIQLKILKSEMDSDDNWSKEKIYKVSCMTGLSESQVYKWCWDQKKKRLDQEGKVKKIKDDAYKKSKDYKEFDKALSSTQGGGVYKDIDLMEDKENNFKNTEINGIKISKLKLFEKSSNLFGENNKEKNSNREKLNIRNKLIEIKRDPLVYKSLSKLEKLEGELLNNSLAYLKGEKLKVGRKNSISKKEVPFTHNF